MMRFCSLRVVLTAGMVTWLTCASLSGAGEREGAVNFSFDQVDIHTFIKLVGPNTGRKFVISDDVTGKITVVSPRVTRAQVYPLLLSILESAGCSVVEEGRMHRVVRIPDRTSPVVPVVGEKERLPPGGMVMKVFRLEHVSAAQVKKTLDTKMGGAKSGRVAAVEETNHVIITDTAESIRRVEKLLAEIDRPGLARVTEVVPLKTAGAEELAAQLSRAVYESESRGEQLKRRLPAVPGSREPAPQGTGVVASPHSNSLILVGPPNRIAALKKIIAKMDVEPPAGRGRLNAVFLKYISAEEAAKSITALLSKTSSTEKGGKRRGRIAIEASAANNALLVDASKADYDEVRRLVEQLDQPVDQVYIEVVIAEVSNSDSFEWGVDMTIMNKTGDDIVLGGSTLADGGSSLLNMVQNGISPRGLTAGLALNASRDVSGNLVTDSPSVVNIDALRKIGKFRIRSNPSLVTQNNREANVSIVNDIPILKSKVEGTGDSREIIQNIERMDVGIKLKITPHIVSANEIRMVLNPSIEAVIDRGPAGTDFAPTIARREVTTTVTVPDGKTVVIAGLTQQDKRKVVRRVPILGWIPILGLLFRDTYEVMEKTNVLIFVTPRIIKDAASAAQLRGELEKKTKLSADEQENGSK